MGADRDVPRQRRAVAKVCAITSGSPACSPPGHVGGGDDGKHGVIVTAAIRMLPTTP